MIGELLINGKDAYTNFGVSMGDGFLDALCSPSPLKDFIENKSRSEHGKQVIISSPKLDERDVSLSFTLEGSSESDFNTKKQAFYSELYKGAIDIKIPAIGNGVYHLIYTGKNVSYAQNTARTFTKISMKFNEPNPNNR